MHDVLVLLGHLRGHWPPCLPESQDLREWGTKGTERALLEPADPTILPHQAQWVGTHLPLQTLLVEGQHTETMQGPGRSVGWG